MRLAIAHGRVIDPAQGISEPMDVLIEHGRIQELGSGFEADEVIDASGCVVCPGLVDINAHLREPGFEPKETIATGSRAAAHGGITSVVSMPDTNPVIDNAGMVEFILRRARETACIKVYPAACATKGGRGEEITEMAELRDVGAVAVTDNPLDIANAGLMRRVLEYAGMVGLVTLCHCEDAALSVRGQMHEGIMSTRLGLAGMPRVAEESRIDRAVRLAELTGAAIHIQQVSTAGGVEVIRQAKHRGLKVTAETAPHYLLLNDTALQTFDTNAKMNPPLREREDTAALITGIQEGVIDCIASGHSPHTPTEKDVEFDYAPFGALGLETLLAGVITALVAPGHVSLDRALAMLTCVPAGIVGIYAGALEPGRPADVIVFDPNASWPVDPKAFASRGRNTPLAGYTLRGLVRHTLCDGVPVYGAAAESGR